MSLAQEQATIEQRRVVITQRYLKGDYQADIARDLGVTQQQISKDLKAIRAAWLVSAVRDFDALKAQELARIDGVEREAWQAWERSRLDKEVSVTEQVEGEGSITVTKFPDGKEITTRKKLKARITREGQAGVPAYLTVILACIERRCKILGLDAPQKFNITIDWDNLSEEQIDRLARGEDPAKVLAVAA